MIECLPTSLCSWNFVARGVSAGSATVEFDWFTEQGRIASPHMNCEVRKHGMLSGRWSLEQAGEVMAEAHKPSAMLRSFEISNPAGNLRLQAESPFVRAFEISDGQQIIGRIRPAHAFTRRATIQCQNSTPEHIQLFAFWLVVVTWRRNARNNN